MTDDFVPDVIWASSPCTEYVLCQMCKKNVKEDSWFDVKIGEETIHVRESHKPCKTCGRLGCYNACPGKVGLGTSSPCNKLTIDLAKELTK